MPVHVTSDLSYVWEGPGESSAETTDGTGRDEKQQQVAVIAPALVADTGGRPCLSQGCDIPTVARLRT